MECEANDHRDDIEREGFILNTYRTSGMPRYSIGHLRRLVGVDVGGFRIGLE